MPCANFRRPALVRYDSVDVSKSDRQTDGQLSERPLAELIREIIDGDLSGAIRLSRPPAKVVVYFEKGKVVFAASNLRAHRLREVLRRQGAVGAALDQSTAPVSDDQFGAALVEKGLLTPAALQEARSAQATEVLRVALLWNDGEWSFDRLVRVAPESRVQVDADQLLLECARHLPLPFLRSRLGVGAINYSVIDSALPLSPIEARTLSGVIAQHGNEISASILANNGLREPDALRGIYALMVAGIARPDDYHTVLSDRAKSSPAPPRVPAMAAAKRDSSVSEEADVNVLFARLYAAKTHYEVLDIASNAALGEIKAAYHDLARRYHPDRFHQSELRPKIESAFARIGRAYETLSDQARRSEYDKTLSSKRPARISAGPKDAAPVAAQTFQSEAPTDRAEAAFQLGSQAMERNQHTEAMRYFGEAAMLAPRVARYRAFYGSALMHNPTQRRTAETELQAALKMEPNNAAFRVMLARLYQQIGLRKRAESEAARALSADPTNASARALLSTLTAK